MLLPDPMEALENSFVEGKILWLAQTILESLLPGELDEWIRRIGLAEAIEKLKYEIQRMETVVTAAKGRANGNKPLARTLGRVKELLYDADDMVDELDYLRLQQQVEGGTIACADELEGTDGDGDRAEAEQEDVAGSGRDNPDIPSSKKRKNWCKAWDDFEGIKDYNGKIQEAKCKYCGVVVKCGDGAGTKGLNTHVKSKKCLNKRRGGGQLPNPTSATDGTPNDTTNVTRGLANRKKMRVNEASTSKLIPNEGHHWNEAQTKMINQIALPAGLHSLPSLKRLEIDSCKSISKLPEGGLPPSLEELEVKWCSRDLTEECRKLATDKLKVKIDSDYVNNP